MAKSNSVKKWTQATSPDPTLEQIARKNSEKLHQWLLSVLPLGHVLGAGFGYKYSKRKNESLPAVILFTKKETSEGEKQKSHSTPSILAGLPTLIYPTEPVVALSDLRASLRPLRMGCSLGHTESSVGSLGGVARNREGRFILSNNHVLANYNQGHEGDEILQPGPADLGRSPRDVVAHLKKWVPIQFDSEVPLENQENYVDAALATPNQEHLEFLKELKQPKTWRGTSDIPVGLEVHKTGRTTGMTTGQILAVHTSFLVEFLGVGKALFKDQVISSFLGLGGDSGSLVLGEVDQSVIGLLFSGSGEITVINPIEAVQNLLGVELATERWKAS